MAVRDLDLPAIKAGAWRLLKGNQESLLSYVRGCLSNLKDSRPVASSADTAHGPKRPGPAWSYQLTHWVNIMNFQVPKGSPRLMQPEMPEAK
jgi:hypothetical protein